MDRATFEKIVGGANVLFSSKELGTVEIEIGPENCLLITQGTDVFAIDSSSPFRLRCLLHGLGIKCDWDEPVTFERLMKLDGAVAKRNNTQVVIGNELFYESLGIWNSINGNAVTTMKQVHLLLEAAGVGR